LIWNLGTRFPLRGVGCNTLCFCSVVICANYPLNIFSNYSWEP
jgi:hypothetical protein